MPNSVPPSPAISVVMPCYNAACHLVTSTGSVLAQTWTDWELVIVDDGSTDDSWRILQDLAASDSRIRVFRQSNSGASRTRNHALREALGEFVAFLDSDDTWEPDFLETMHNAIQADPEAALAYCGWQNLGLAANRCQPYVPPDYEGPGKLAALLEECRWPIHSALTRLSVIREADCFDERLSSCMDFDLWLRIGSAHKIILVPRVLSYYHFHGGEQITKNRSRLAINHWLAQQRFLQAHPEYLRRLGYSHVRELTHGELLRRGFESYWARDIDSARIIFRTVMKTGYGRLRDWLYMMPAWLPATWHKALIRLWEKTG